MVSKSAGSKSGPAKSSGSNAPAEKSGNVALLGLGPLALLAVFVALFLAFGPLGLFEAGFPPVEELTIDRVILRPDEMMVHVTNGGPDPVTVAQVMVDDAYWTHTIVPDRTVPRLGRATITIPYQWVEGEAHHIKLLTSSGVAIEHEVAVIGEFGLRDGRHDRRCNDGEPHDSNFHGMHE